MKANVMAAVSLDSSAERFSGLVFSLTIAVEMVMVCMRDGGDEAREKQASRERDRSKNYASSAGGTTYIHVEGGGGAEKRFGSSLVRTCRI